MLLSKERLFYLLDAWSNHTAAEAEEQELLEWVNENDHHEILQEYIQKLSAQERSGQAKADVDWQKMYDQILQESALPQPKQPLRRLPWYRLSAAAAAIIMLGTGIYFYLKPSVTKPVVATVTQPAPPLKDVAAPTSSKAILTLADGRKIELDSMGNGTLVHQGTVQVVKQADGHITYNGSASEDLYNTLNVPRGSKVVTIQLSDGTQVWLNSESSLRYPASFRGAERKVEITGEAYFEVAHNPSVPFIVKKDGLEVKVLGTHFNINTYSDERVDKVTLLEGSISVSKGDARDIVKPGQQAQVSEQIKVVNGVNTEEVMAWKNGIFQFGEKSGLHLIMRKLERWYDVEVQYDGVAQDQQFGGEIPMNSNLSQVLEILKTSGVKFTIEGKKVVVKS